VECVRLVHLVLRPRRYSSRQTEIVCNSRTLHDRGNEIRGQVFVGFVFAARPRNLHGTDGRYLAQAKVQEQIILRSGIVSYFVASGLTLAKLAGVLLLNGAFCLTPSPSTMV
jgi:hypothetical protein